jgi:hypothetical protein
MPDRLVPDRSSPNAPIPSGASPSVLVSYRPTAPQAIARGLYYGGLFAAFVVILVATASLVLGAAVVKPLTVVALLAPILVGGVAGFLVHRRDGVDVDHRGVYGSRFDIQPWPRVVDLRTERRGGRTGVTAYLDTGAAIRLAAPYDGRLLAHDPGFEQKYFTLRQIWETHRSWNISG